MSQSQRATRFVQFVAAFQRRFIQNRQFVVDIAPIYWSQWDHMVLQAPYCSNWTIWATHGDKYCEYALGMICMGKIDSTVKNTHIIKTTIFSVLSSGIAFLFVLFVYILRCTTYTLEFCLWCIERIIVMNSQWMLFIVTTFFTKRKSLWKLLTEWVSQNQNYLHSWIRLLCFFCNQCVTSSLNHVKSS